MNLKFAVQRAFQAKTGIAFNYAAQGVIVVLTYAALTLWERLGFPSEIMWLRWPGAVLAVIFLIFLEWKTGSRKLLMLYDKPGWGWTNTGLIAGGLFLKLIPLLQGQWANRQEYGLLLFSSNIFILGSVVALALGIYLTAKPSA